MSIDDSNNRAYAQQMGGLNRHPCVACEPKPFGIGLAGI